MNKKAMIIAGAAVLALTIAGVTMASPMGRGMMGGGRGMGGGMGAGPMAIQAQQLSESQQAEWKALQQKNFQLKKERIQLMVKTGYLTQEQADAKLKMMDAAHSFKMKNNLVAPGARLSSPLTDEQKADMKKMAEQRLAIQKENLARLVTAGQITQTQADAKIEWMQKRINEVSENGFAGHGPGMGGPGMGGGRGPGNGPRF
jgi:hypothetical protein